jgi:rRNA maturation RNase YbeY
VTTAKQKPARFALDFSFVPQAPAPEGVSASELEHLAEFVLGAEEATGSWDVTVVLVDDERLQTLHRDFMAIDEPTDIMTFPADDAPRASGGELVISVDHARSQAGAWGLTPAAEIQFLVVHGLLHLLGWRDDSDQQRQTMLARQQELFDSWQQTKVLSKR